MHQDCTPGPERRCALQALTLHEFVAECEALAQRFPRLFRDRQAAYHYLRLIIEPCVLDVTTDDGRYVIAFGGQRILVQPRSAYGLTAIAHEAREWFSYLYPPLLSDMPIFFGSGWGEALAFEYGSEACHAA